MTTKNEIRNRLNQVSSLMMSNDITLTTEQFQTIRKWEAYPETENIDELDSLVLELSLVTIENLTNLQTAFIETL